MNTKVCSRCGIEKTLDDFYFKNKKLNIYYPECKDCRKLYLANNKEKLREQSKQRRIKNADKIKEQKKIYYEKYKEQILEKQREKYKENAEYIKARQRKYNEENKEMILERQKQYYQDNKEERLQKQKEYYSDHVDERHEYNKKYREANIEKLNEYQKQYYEENKERLNAISKEYSHTEKMRIWRREHKKERKNTDPLYKLSEQTRTLINNCFRKQGYKKNSKTEKILGCDFNTFYNYLLKTYKDNYGIDWDGKEEVHIDHIYPISKAKTEEEIIKLCNYKNLQLLRATDNLKKSDNIDYKINN